MDAFRTKKIVPELCKSDSFGAVLRGQGEFKEPLPQEFFSLFFT